ncbi:FMN-binding protein [Fundicoccus culcitae]|uniref:FMN-binding protein n=1 Tax=Fundicoccus culcitae TaxID=2969821 RepID=A0ABY5P8I6_9LACT|nr:FMN-binding protein [Fundicoccus culcitae]UUX34680.1 FMN-binding protein [Fundicoccus culcitae]
MEEKKQMGIIFSSLALLIVIMIIIWVTFQIQYTSLNYTPVDMADVPDGVYTGRTETILLTVEVEVEVNDHKMTGIEFLEHETTYEEAGNHIKNMMVKENTIDVDTVSSATASTNVIKSAVNKALLSAVEE